MRALHQSWSRAFPNCLSPAVSLIDFPSKKNFYQWLNTSSISLARALSSMLSELSKAWRPYTFNWTYLNMLSFEASTMSDERSVTTSIATMMGIGFSIFHQVKITIVFLQSMTHRSGFRSKDPKLAILAPRLHWLSAMSPTGWPHHES